MFGKKKKDSLLLKIENDTLRKALKDIATLEHKTTPKDGTAAKTDYEMTVFLIRERANVALSVVENVRERNRFVGG